MTGWAVRGIGIGLINVLVRVLLGAAVSQWPLNGSQLRWVAFAFVVLAVLVWAGIDGIRDRRRYPDPDRGEDLTMIWLKAAVLGGLLAGLVSWIVGFFVDFSLGQNSIVFELTSGAAFTILTVFITASIATFVGRQLVNREAKKKLTASDAEHAHERELVNAGGNTRDGSTDRSHDKQWTAEHGDADTEVFQAVDAEGKPRQQKTNKHGTADGS